MALLRDRYARIGFWVPTSLVVVATLAGAIAMVQDTSGYAGLLFIVYILYGLPAILGWLVVGSLVAKARGPEGAWKRFAVGAALAFGVAILLFSGTCFAIIGLSMG